jgi:hypothetical protein
MANGFIVPVLGSKYILTEPIPSNEWARTAGKIFDECWRSDDTIVGSELCDANRRMQVNIHGTKAWTWRGG